MELMNLFWSVSTPSLIEFHLGKIQWKKKEANLEFILSNLLITPEEDEENLLHQANATTETEHKCRNGMESVHKNKHTMLK